MFKRNLSPTFQVEVTVNIPGEAKPSTFTGHFKRATTAELEADAGLPDKDLVRKYLKGWELMDEDTKQPVPYSDEEREALLLITPVPQDTARAFVMASRGLKAKN